ncbi:hypothetical protein LshimejAT787_0803400 [Lyophyllum shimeji]|uniref:Uncharacterized protein n=1 Tax=Lyophyllum shimeji TaxID=47721 RepID=A0A9P3PS08_LYOSH|nr:hypothetical protein LshimejAT787_0803400 [Lyophyllum shimeji]
MSAAFRLISSNSRLVARAIRPSAPVRAFHSPFAALGDSPLTSTSHPTPATVYEKQTDFSSEPVALHGGSRTYVVSQPDVSSKYYEVPSGAYPTSSPYINYAAADPPATSGAQFQNIQAE